MVNWKEHRGDFCPHGDDRTNPSAVCAAGAANLVTSGDCARGDVFDADYRLFRTQYGMEVGDAFDQGMPLEHIYGMCRALGL
jgi:hypothetical protein